MTITLDDALEQLAQDPSPANQAQAFRSVDIDLKRIDELCDTKLSTLSGLETTNLITSVARTKNDHLLFHVVLNASHLGITLALRSSIFQEGDFKHSLLVIAAALHARGVFMESPFMTCMDHAVEKGDQKLFEGLTDWYLQSGPSSSSIFKKILCSIEDMPAGFAPAATRALKRASTGPSSLHENLSDQKLTWKQIVVLLAHFRDLPTHLRETVARSCEPHPDRIYLLQSSAHARMAFQQILKPGISKIVASPWSVSDEASGRIDICRLNDLADGKILSIPAKRPNP